MKLKMVLYATAIPLFSFSQLKFADLKVDTTITGFRFAADFQGTQVFTKNGPSDLKSVNPSAYSFTIAPNVASKTAISQFEQFVNTSKAIGYKVNNIQRRDTVLNGNAAFYITYVETNDKTNYENRVFNAFVIKNDTVIIFVSGDLDRGKYFDKFKQTFYSVKL